MEDLVDGHMEAKMMIKGTRMRLEVAVKTKEETIQIIPMIRIVENREEEEEDKELGEEDTMENVSTIMKKGIDHLNVLNAKEVIMEETTSRVEV